MGSSTNPTPFSHPDPKEDGCSYYLGILLLKADVAQCSWLFMILPGQPSFCCMVPSPQRSCPGKARISLSLKHHLNRVTCSHMWEPAFHVEASTATGNHHSLAYRFEDEGVRRKLLGKSENLITGYWEEVKLELVWERKTQLTSYETGSRLGFLRAQG